MTRVLIALALSLFVFAPTQVIACPKCNACKVDHERVCKAECTAGDMKEAANCYQGCEKEKCAGDCSACGKESAKADDQNKDGDCKMGTEECKAAKADNLASPATP